MFQRQANKQNTSHQPGVSLDRQQIPETASERERWLGSAGRIGNQAATRLLQRRAAGPRAFRTSIPKRPNTDANMVLQRKCACGGTPASASGECERCSKMKVAGFQTKLRISEPGDVYEQEADRVADQVISMSLHSPVGKAPMIQRACATCAAEEESILRKQALGQTVTPATAGDGSPFGMVGEGQPLPKATRAYFEPRFGRDFGDVRIHTDAAANKSAQRFNSLAYTFGRHLVFAHGQFAPGSERGRRLLAHELTHVVQQSVRQRPMLARQVAPTPGYTEEQDQMLNCMIRAQRPAGGVVSDKEAFDICAKKLEYRHEFFAPTEDDRRQIEQGVLISPEDLHDYAEALKQYAGWVRAGRVSPADRQDIDPRIDFCERMLKILNLEASADERSARQARADLSAAAAVAAVPAVGVVVTAPSAPSTLAQNAANWGAGELEAPAEWAAGTQEIPIVTETTEAAELAATAGEATAVGTGAALALSAGEIFLAAYLTYRLWRWSNQVRNVRTTPEIPDTIRDMTRRLRRITPLEPTPEPRVEPRPREDPRRRRRRCPYPTGLWPDDPIEIIWFKYKLDYFYPAHIEIYDGVLTRDDPTAKLPDGTSVGVRSELWPECNKIYRYIPTPRGDAARHYRQALQHAGYDWEHERTQPDHIQDLAWAGPDAFGNLWPYEQSTNQSTGASQNLQQRISFCPTPNGRPIVNERIVSNRGYLYGRYFIIRRFKLHSGAPDLITCP
jgi:Domain of unknown function (DUF4157)